MKIHIHFARKKRQLKGLVKQLKKYANNSLQYRETLEKIKFLFNDLKYKIAQRYFKKTFAGLSLAVLMSLGTLKAQTFAAPVTNPFGINITAGTFSYLDITLGDINNDGTLDIIGGSYNGRDFIGLENTGTVTAPVFGTPQINPYNLTPFAYEINPILADFDNDGDLDILGEEFFYDYYYYSYGSEFKYYENIGTNAAPDYAAPVLNPFGLSSNSYYVAPTMADIDNDGDLDLIAGDQDGDIFFFENTGTSTAPNFGAAQTNPFGIDLTRGGNSGDLSYSSPTLADLDNDGDLDLLVGVYHYDYYTYNYESTFMYFENIGTQSTPSFGVAQLNPFGLTGVQYIDNITPEFVDIDGDGDQDIMMGDQDGNITFFENTSPPSVNIAPMSADTSVNLNEDMFHAFAETDFPFTDADLGETLNTLKIVETVGVGSLELNSVAVVNGQDIAVADLVNLVFTPLANDNGNAYDEFTFRVSDGTDFSVDTFTLTFNVLPVNDAPESMVNTVTTDEDVAYNFVAADFAFTDIDAGDALVSITVSSLPTIGSLELNGASVTAGQVILVADIPNLTFTPLADENGLAYDSFDFSVSDGTDSSIDYAMTINVTPVNDAPTASDNAVTTDEDVPYTFTAADFGFNDIDAGDALVSITITSIESEGSLQLNGVDVTAGQVITAADIANLTFTPASGAFGVAYDSFEFTVSDGNASSNSQVMTINVTEVTGIRNAIEVNALAVYPNPVVNNLQVNFENPSNEAAVIEIYNLVGQLVYKNEVSNKGFNELNINASKLQRGTYILRVQIGEKQSNIKFVK